jgi:hypothetical protein
MLFTDLPSSHAQASCSGDGQVRPRHGIVGLAAREIKIVLDFDICVADALDAALSKSLRPSEIQVYLSLGSKFMLGDIGDCLLCFPAMSGAGCIE